MHLPNEPKLPPMQLDIQCGYFRNQDAMDSQDLFQQPIWDPLARPKEFVDYMALPVVKPEIPDPTPYIEAAKNMLPHYLRG